MTKTYQNRRTTDERTGASIFEVRNSKTGELLLRTYNQRDARIEAAYLNKFGRDAKENS